MPQPPYFVDQIQIEPGETGTRLIDRDPADGSLRFSDDFATATLLQLMGLRNVTGVFIVGRAGEGAPYTSIQDALDAVPSSSSSAAPSVILVHSGVYSENLVIEKDGVVVHGMGGVTVTSSSDHTVKVRASIATTPLHTILRNLTIIQGGAGLACVEILGADSFASGTVTVNSAPLAAGDTVGIGAGTLTGIAASRTSGSDDFSTLGGTPDAIAAEIAAAINDPANSFAATVEASVLGAVVTITAVTAGTGGNSIALSVSTTPPGGLTASGGTLTGGGAAGSAVASEGFVATDCRLRATGVGSYQVLADTANYINIRGGTFRGSSSTSLVSAANCAAVRLWNVEWVNDLALSYDTGLDQPADPSSEYYLTHLGRANDAVVNLVGEGIFVVHSCPKVGDLTIGGDRTTEIGHSTIGLLSLAGTTAATLRNSERGTASIGAGTPTLQETRLVGSAPIVAAPILVSFEVAQPDTNYEVFISPSVPTDTFAVTAKSVTDFTVTSATGATPATIGYTVLRNL